MLIAMFYQKQSQNEIVSLNQLQTLNVINLKFTFLDDGEVTCCI